MTPAVSSSATRTILTVCVLWGVTSLISIGWNAARNPMAARERALESRLSSIQIVDEDLPEPDQAPLKEQRDAIVQKTALWKALVAPAAKPESKPDLLEKLAGVQVGRQQIAKGDAISIKIRMAPEDRQGRWVTVGDKINGLTIKEIRPDAVVFSVKQDGKEYTAELPRK